MNESSEQYTSDADRLIQYANKCLDSCIEMYKRLIFRGRLIVVSTTGILTLVATLLAASLDKISGAEADSITTALAIALIPGLFGLFKCVQASASYLLHGEEDTGALPNPVSFGNIGHGWWLTQPTVDTVEERYLPHALMLSLRWRKKRGLFLRNNVLRNIFHFYNMTYQRWKLARSIRSISKQLHRYPVFRKALMDKYRDLIQYGENSHGVIGIRERGASDLANLISFVMIADIDKEFSDRSRFRKRNFCDEPHGKRVMQEYHQRIENAARIDYVELVNKDCNTIAWLLELKLPETLHKDYAESINSRPDKYLMHKDLDILHHPVFVRGSQYYMQFSEEFGERECGNSIIREGKSNGTGSSRPYSFLTEEELEKLQDVSNGFSRVSWRIFMSTYYAAQDKRSSNWNTWYRVKFSERRFIEGLSWVLFSITVGVCVFIVNMAMSN